MPRIVFVPNRLERKVSQMPDREELLAGGNVAPVVRIGNTVRRMTGPWTPGVHALLRHLQEVGFEGAPRVLGVDEQNREILTFIEGEPGLTREARDTSDKGLVEIARLLRRYHDATATFDPPHRSEWRFMVGAPRRGDVICHNDISPYNTIYRSGCPRAFIDWDLAAPGPRSWDIAYALWRFVPLYNDEDARREGFAILPRGPRMRLFCDAYGMDDRSDLIALVRSRQQVVFDTIRTWGEAGVPGFDRMWAEEGAAGPLRDIAFLDQSRDEWERALDSPEGRG